MLDNMLAVTWACWWLGLGFASWPRLLCFALFFFCFLGFNCLLFSIIPHLLVVGYGGLCPGLRTMSALFTLVRRRVNGRYLLVVG